MAEKKERTAVRQDGSVVVFDDGSTMGVREYERWIKSGKISAKPKVTDYPRVKEIEELMSKNRTLEGENAALKKLLEKGKSGDAAKELKAANERIAELEVALDEKAGDTEKNAGAKKDSE